MQVLPTLWHSPNTSHTSLDSPINFGRLNEFKGKA